MKLIFLRKTKFYHLGNNNFCRALFQAQAGIINYYAPGHTLSPHTDHSEWDNTLPLVSISLGLPAIYLTLVKWFSGVNVFIWRNLLFGVNFLCVVNVLQNINLHSFLQLFSVHTS